MNVWISIGTCSGRKIGSRCSCCWCRLRRCSSCVPSSRSFDHGRGGWSGRFGGSGGVPSSRSFHYSCRGGWSGRFGGSGGVASSRSFDHRRGGWSGRFGSSSGFPSGNRSCGCSGRTLVHRKINPADGPRTMQADLKLSDDIVLLEGLFSVAIVGRVRSIDRLLPVPAGKLYRRKAQLARARQKNRHSLFSDLPLYPGEPFLPYQ
eukprot:scaffold37398_cov183-Amphora_coffeaeformis.AAC.2